MVPKVLTDYEFHLANDFAWWKNRNNFPLEALSGQRMHRRTASCLIFLLLAGALLCHGERLKVQVVQTHTGIKLGGAGSVVDPDGAGPSVTRCNGDSGTNAGDLASTCNRPPVHGAPAPSEDRGDYSLFFDVIVIMPD